MKEYYRISVTRPVMMGTLSIDSEKPTPIRRVMCSIGKAIIVCAVVLATCAAAYINPQAFSTGFTIGFVASSVGARR